MKNVISVWNGQNKNFDSKFYSKVKFFELPGHTDYFDQSKDKEEKKKLKEKEQKASAPQVTIAECPICERKFGFCEEKLKSFENMGTFKLLKHYENNHDVRKS